MFSRGIFEGVEDYGLATVSPIGNRSRMNSWLHNVRVPYGMNVNELIGQECIYDIIGGKPFIIGAYVKDEQIPERYIKTFGKERVIWAGDFRAIRTKADGTIAISKVAQNGEELVISDIIEYTPEDESVRITVDNFILSSIGASNDGNFTIRQDKAGNVEYTFKGKTNVYDKANRFKLRISNPISPHGTTPPRGLLEFEVDNTPTPISPATVIPDISKLKIRMGSGPDGRDGFIASVNDMIALSIGKDLSDPNHLLRIATTNLPAPFELRVNVDGSFFLQSMASEINIKPTGDIEAKNKSGSIKLTKTGVIEVKNASGSITMDASGKVTFKGTSVTVESPSVTVKGGMLTVNGASAPGSGPFCALPNCLYSGALHTGNKVTGT